MDLRFNTSKSLMLITITLTLSSLFLSSNAIPSTRVLEIAPTSAPTSSPKPYSPFEYIRSLFKEGPGKAPQQFSPEILQFCTGTENPTLCAETITPYMKSSFDPIKALGTEMNATNDKAYEVAEIIARLIKDPSTDKKAIDALDICKSQYDEMLDSIKDAMNLVAQHNVVDAYYKFSSVISDKSSCDDAFQESPGVVNPFADIALAVFQLGGNCLAIMDGIVNNNKL